VKEFLRVVTPAQVYDMLGSFSRVGPEQVRLEDAPGRALYEDIRSPEDLPPGPRATMDGYAVRAEDTFGATDSLPAYLEVAGRVEMGKVPSFGIQTGRAAAIPTGGFLPAGADAVVMVEHTNQAGPSEIEVCRPVTAGENVLAAGADVSRGDLLLPRGRRIGAQDTGVLAGVGLCDLRVYRQPRVALASSGNEIVPADRNPAPGEIRDTNRYTVGALVRTAGAVAVPLGIVPDEAGALRDAIERGLDEADLVVISGGSSVGERDLVAQVVSGLSECRTLAHGVAVRPGQPTLLAEIRGKAFFGLPGHPVSAMVVAQVFLVPFLRYLQGEALVQGLAGRKVDAVLSTSIPSVQGREEYVRVRLVEREGILHAEPVFGRSSMLSTMTRSDGLVRVPLHAEGLAGGEKVEVVLF
jgi:molybdopterin molybdotransferase